MRESKVPKLLGILLLVAGIALLLQTCTSSDPSDLMNPSNSVSPQRIGSDWNRKLETIKAAPNVEFQGKDVKKTNLASDLEALAKAQKKYEASLKKKEEDKKKKAKKVAKKKPSAKKTIVQRNNTRRNISGNSEETPLSPVSAFSGSAAARRIQEEASQPSPTPPQQGYEFWRNLVFSNPSQQTSEQLLAAYLQGQISAEWFYAITDEMVNSTNSILQESAINLIAMSPSSESFQRLSLLTDRNVAPHLKVLARESMNDVYKNFAYIQVIAAAVQNTNTTIAYHGARMIRLSAETNLNATTASTFIKVISKANANAYTQLLPILTRIIENTQNERLREFAQSAFEYISQFNSNDQLTADLN